jgi:hypothetical protein
LNKVPTRTATMALTAALTVTLFMTRMLSVGRGGFKEHLERSTTFVARIESRIQEGRSA